MNSPEILYLSRIDADSMGLQRLFFLGPTQPARKCVLGGDRDAAACAAELTITPYKATCSTIEAYTSSAAGARLGASQGANARGTTARSHRATRAGELREGGAPAGRPRAPRRGERGNVCDEFRGESGAPR